MRIQDMQVVPRRPAPVSHVAAVGHLQTLVLRAALRGHNHHAVRRTDTPDGGRRRIFQHRHLLDVVRVQVQLRAFHREAVHHNQGLRVGVQGAHATDNHLVILVEVKPRHLPFELLAQAHGVHRLHVLLVDEGERTGGAPFLNGLHAGHYHLVHLLGCRFQHHAHRLVRHDGQLLRLHADE